MARLIDRISRSISRESTKSTSSSRNTSSKSSDSKSSPNSKKTTVTPEVTYKPSSAAKKIQEPAKLSTTTQTQKSQSTSSSKSAPSSIAKEFNTLANSIKSTAKAVAKEVSKATVTVSNQVQQSVKKVISHDRESEKTTNKNLTSTSISKNVISSPSKMASDVKQVTGNLPKTSTFAFTATKVAYSAAQGAGGGALNYTKPIITKSNDKKPSPQDLKKLVNEYKITDIPTSSQTKQNISNSKQIQIWENAKERNTTPKSNNAVDRFFGGAIQGTVRTGIDFVNGGISTADWMLNTSAKAKKIQIKTAIDSIPLLPENISNIIKSNIATFQTGNAEQKGEIYGRIMGDIAIGAVGKALAPDILPIFKKNKADYIPETEWEPLKTSKGGTGSLGIVESRINIANGSTRFSPSNKAGLEHVLDRHFNLGKNAGQFTISVDELKSILGNKDIIKSPVTVLETSGQYSRTVNVGEVVGTIKPSIPEVGGKPTTWMEIITDSKGNLITTYPCPAPK